jgi:hypothetical protein
VDLENVEKRSGQARGSRKVNLQIFHEYVSLKRAFLPRRLEVQIQPHIHLHHLRPLRAFAG